MADYVHGCSCSYRSVSVLPTRKSANRQPKLPVGHRPVTRAFECVAVDVVEYKKLSQRNRFILSVIDHLTRFVAFIPIKDKAARTIVRNLIERVFSVFGPPETLHSDQGKEFENELVNALQSIFYVRKRAQPPIALRATLF